MARQKSGAERRRSPRIEHHIPIKIRAQGADGKPFEVDAEADQVSYHGARVTAAAAFHSGAVVTVQSLTTSDTARFRIVWCLEKPGGNKWHLGLELASGDPKVWGVDFAAHEVKHS
jgi:hypothetical protein